MKYGGNHGNTKRNKKRSGVATSEVGAPTRKYPQGSNNRNNLRPESPVNK